MKETYELKNGQIKLVHCGYLYKLQFKNFLRETALMVSHLLLLIGVCFITWIVYRNCIVQLDLEHTISLGAVFATLGSSLVAVSSLVCNEQYSQFMDNIRILEESLFKKNKWERWPFVKRVQKNKIAHGEYLYYILYNPSIIFRGEQWELKVLLPSGKYDFRELSVYRTIFQLTWYMKKYSIVLLNQNKVKDILIWRCLTKAYLNILLYRWNQSIVWIGSYFIFSSVFFSFFYIHIADWIR